MVVAKNLRKLQVVLLVLIICLIPVITNADEINKKISTIDIAKYTEYDRSNIILDWQKIFRYDNNIRINDAVETADGGYLLGGYRQTNASSLNYYIMKIDSTGQKIWDKVFGQGELNSISTLQQTSDGGFIIAGFHKEEYKANLNPSVEIDATVMKLNKNGNLEWSTELSDYHGNIFKVIELNNKNFLIIGQNTKLIKNESDKEEFKYEPYITQLDKVGDIVWENIYTSVNFDMRLNDVIQTKDNGYITTGHIIEAGEYSDCIVIKYDEYGDVEWDKVWGADNIDYGCNIIQTDDGEYIVSGYSDSSYIYSNQEETPSHCTVSLLDKSGNLKWMKKLGTEPLGATTKLIRTQDNNFQLISNDIMYPYIHIVKFNKEGNTVDCNKIVEYQMNSQINMNEKGQLWTTRRNTNKNSNVYEILLRKFTMDFRSSKDNSKSNKSLLIYPDDSNIRTLKSPSLLTKKSIAQYEISRYCYTTSTKSGGMYLAISASLHEDKDNISTILKKVGPDLKTQIIKEFTSEDYTMIDNVLELEDNNILITSYSKDRLKNSISVIDINGNILYRKTFESNDINNIQMVLQLDSGEIQFVCESNYKYVLIKMDRNLQIISKIPLSNDITDSYNNIKKLSNGDLLILGKKNNKAAGFIKRINSKGEILWNKYYGESKYSISDLYDLILAENGDFITLSSYNRDTIVISRLNNTGNIIWQKKYFCGTYNIAPKMLEKENSNFTFCINFESSLLTDGNGKGDCLLVNMDTNGNVTWEKVLGSGYDDCYKYIMHTDDNKYFVLYEKFISNKQDFKKSVYELIINRVDSTFERSTLPSIQWQRVAGGSQHDVPTDLIATKDGYIINGFTYSKNINPLINKDFVVSVSNNGRLQWILKDTNMSIKDIKQTTDEGYILAGEVYSVKSKVSDLHIIRINKNGDVIWEKSYSKNTDDELLSLHQVNDDDYIISGLVHKNINNKEKQNICCLFISIDKNGNKTDEFIYDITDTTYIRKIKRTADKGFIIIYNKEDKDKTYISKIVKIDGSGNEQWLKESNDNEWFNDMVECKDSYKFIGYNNNKQRTQLLELDKNGNVIFEKDYNFEDMTVRPNGIITTKDQGHVIIGEVDYVNDTKKSDCIIIKVDKSGNKVWEKIIGGSGNDVPISIQQTEDNGYILLGYSDSDDGDVTSNHGGYDYWIVKLSPEGIVQD